MNETDNVAVALFRDAFAAFEQNHVDLAAKGFREVLDADPNNAEALYFLAVIAYRDGRPADSLEPVTRAIALRPDAADCHNLRGLALMALQRHEEACNALREAIACEPSFAEAENNLGAALEAMGKLEDAEAAYRRAVTLRPDYAQAYCNLARCLLGSGRPAEAEAACRDALARQPDLADARYNLAVAQQRQGALTEAEATVGAALAASPQDAALLRFLGVLRHRRGDLSGAEAALRDALAHQPALSEAHDNLAGVLLDQGRVDAAEACFRQALELNPADSRAHSNLLLCRNYYAADNDALFEAHRQWAARHATPIAPLPATARTENPRLRIGYVSGDFRRHSVAYFFEQLLAHRDRERFETFCYANMENPDAVTARLQAASDNWRWVAGLNDDRLAASIRADEIDILVDLSGHSAGNRLLTFQRRSAPVQVTWLGYPNTTGLTAIDYRITDAIADPPGAVPMSTETLVRLEDGFLCYRPPPDAPGVAPARADGPVTFGSFNNLRKVTPAVIALWVEILSRAPDSRLLLKARPLADPATARRISSLFEDRGVSPERIELRGAVTSPVAHLESYGDIDVALDPFPYNGTTTTCEALWMGVPVVTLAGDRHAGRVGASLLTRAGFEDCIATDTRGYIAIALRLAAESDAREEAREKRRRTMAASPLCDGDGFARRMEEAFEGMAKQAGTTPGS